MTVPLLMSVTGLKGAFSEGTEPEELLEAIDYIQITFRKHSINRRFSGLQ